VLVAGLVGLAFLWVTAAEAAERRGPLRRHRTLETSDVLDLPDLPGLAFPPAGGSLLVPDWPRSGSSLLVRLGDRNGAGEVSLELADPINLTWDARGRRLLAYDDAAREIVVVKRGSLRRSDAKGYGVARARGLAVDPATGDLLLLDAAHDRIVRIAPGRGGDLAGPALRRAGAIRSLELAGGLGELRGLAVDPESGHYFVASAERRELYELGADGVALAVHPLSDPGEPLAMVFSPSSDRTDPPRTSSLFVASREAGGEAQVAEYSFTEVAVFEAALAASLVQTIATSAFSPPSPDPSGVDYVAPLDSLLVSDGEVDEMAVYQGANVWEVSRTGAVRRTFTTTAYSDEPTGVGASPNGHLFVSDDDDKEIYVLAPGPDGRVGTADDVRTHFDTKVFGNTDPEGVAWGAGALWIADGVNAEVFRIAPGPNGAFDGVAPAGDDQVTHFDTSALGVSDPEGIAYDAAAGQVLVVGKPATQVARVTTSGALVEMIDVSAAAAKKPAGLALAPGSLDPRTASLWIAARGVDNGDDPNENDGKLYEFSLGGAPPPPTNLPPTVSAGPDRAVQLPAVASLDGNASDDGLPVPPGALTVAWSQTSGAGTVAFANRSAVDTTASFPGAGSYTLRLTASDGQHSAFDEMKVEVTSASSERVVQIRIGASSDDAEQGLLGAVATNGDDLELVFTALVNQTVGLRFPAVDVPRGAVILEAWVQFKADEVHRGATTLRIQGQKAANAGTFVATPRNVSSRPRTSASVTWSPPAWGSVGAAGAAQRTPSLVPVIQEIVNQGGWVRGNALALIVTGTGTRTAESWDGDRAGAPLLHLRYR
jgi:uncharacterized protein YjiK